ncbi:MAG: helix-turn-helix transcriptional regulator [Dehalococcoidia bacterium]|nr:helix-turn-helix transcriptional regulator [Dehalococcoidia bacterium]
MKRRKPIPPHRAQLGAALRAQRLKLGLSQEALAEIVDCHRNFVGRLERGEQNPTVDMLVRLAKALRCSVADLVKDACL